MTDDPSALERSLGRFTDEEPADGEVDIHFLPVGEGQATVVRTADRTLLYDGGPGPLRNKDSGPYGETALVDALEALGVDHVDDAVVSHLHADHFLGMETLFDAADDPDRDLSVGSVHVSRQSVEAAADGGEPNPPVLKFLKRASEAATGADPDSLTDVLRGESLHVVDDDEHEIPLNEAGDVTATLHCSYDDVSAGDSQSSSKMDIHSTLCHVRSVATGREALLTGDAYDGGIYGNVDEDMLARLDVVDLPKHGSAKGAETEAFLADADAAVGTISHAARPEERVTFEHPHAETLVDAAVLSAADGLYGTGVHGAVSVSMTEEGVTVGHGTGYGVEPTALALADHLSGVDGEAVEDAVADRLAARALSDEVAEAASEAAARLGADVAPEEVPVQRVAAADGTDGVLSTPLPHQMASSLDEDPETVAERFADELADVAAGVDGVATDGGFVSVDASEDLQASVLDACREVADERHRSTGENGPRDGPAEEGEEAEEGGRDDSDGRTEHDRPPA